MPRRRSSARTRATLLPLTSPLVRAPFLSVPSHTKMSCIAVFSATLHRNHAIEFFQGRHARLDLAKARGSKVGDALLLGHVSEHERVAVFHNESRHIFRFLHHLFNALPSLVAFVSLVSTYRFIHRDTNKNNHKKTNNQQDHRRNIYG